MIETIAALCSSIREETTAIERYNERIIAAEKKMTATQNVFRKLRQEHMEHLQDLCIELSKYASVSKPMEGK